MIWYVALGSAVGGVLRYLLGGWVQERAGTTFPVQTLLINVSGSLLLGFLQRYALETTAISAEVRTMLTVGVCGGYTTFSTFSFETVRMLEDGDWRGASLYIGLSVALSVAAALLGIVAAKELLAVRGRI
jgi:fluoride exporter